LLALVAKGESFEEAERFGDAGHWFGLGLGLPT
jgi:hypothetical protein